MNTDYETSGAGREPGGMQRLLGFVERGLAAQQAVDGLTAEREPEPITADVTGSMQRGLAYDPADMTGPAVSLDRIAEPNDDPIDPGHPEAIPNALRQLLYWHSLGRVTTDRAVDRIRDLFAPGGTADLNVRLELGRILAEASVGRIQPVEAIDQILAVRRMDPSPHAAEQRAVIDQVVAGLGADERLLAHLAGQSAELVQAFVDLVGAARDAWLDPPASHEGTTESGQVTA